HHVVHPPSVSLACLVPLLRARGRGPSSWGKRGGFLGHQVRNWCPTPQVIRCGGRVGCLVVEVVHRLRKGLSERPVGAGSLKGSGTLRPAPIREVSCPNTYRRSVPSRVACRPFAARCPHRWPVS